MSSGGVFMLTLAGCKARLRRCCAALDQNGIGLAVLSDYRSVYYLSGHLREEEIPQLLIVKADGKTILITDVQPLQYGADEVSTYKGYTADWPVGFAAVAAQAAQSLTAKLPRITGPVRRVALEKDRLSAVLFEAILARWPAAEHADATRLLNKLRKSCIRVKTQTKSSLSRS
jgi:Xaa-Pro aminopeptidase